jgi:hypothetical protein
LRTSFGLTNSLKKSLPRGARRGPPRIDAEPFRFRLETLFKRKFFNELLWFDNHWRTLPFEKGESATGVLITDKCHWRGGDGSCVRSNSRNCKLLS